MFWLLLFAAVADYKTLKIPNSISALLYLNGLGALIFDYERILIHGLGLVLVPLLPLIILFISKGKLIGAGDIKLLGAIGMTTGLNKGLVSLFIACVLGIIVCVFSGFNKKMYFAFGPCISLATFIAVIIQV